MWLSVFVTCENFRLQCGSSKSVQNRGISKVSSMWCGCRLPSLQLANMVTMGIILLRGMTWVDTTITWDIRILCSFSRGSDSRCHVHMSVRIKTYECTYLLPLTCWWHKRDDLHSEHALLYDIFIRSLLEKFKKHYKLAPLIRTLFINWLLNKRWSEY